MSVGDKSFKEKHAVRDTVTEGSQLNLVPEVSAEKEKVSLFRLRETGPRKRY